MALPKLNTPTYTMIIPSMQKEVEYRPFNVKEQKTLMMAKESNDEKAMIRATRELIRDCLFDKVDIKKLTMFDFEYIFLMCRAKSVGETSDVMIKCSECEDLNPVSINIDDAEVFGEIKSSKEKTVALTDEVGVTLNYPGFESALEILQQNQGETEAALDVIVSCVDTIYDKENVYPAADHTFDELKEFVESLSTKQFEQITEFFNDAPYVGLNSKFVCKKCEAKNELTIQGLKNFF